MRFLIFIQTPEELEWAYAQARRSPDSSYCLLRLGDIHAGVLPRLPEIEAPGNCEPVSEEDLGIDAELLMQEAHRLQDDLWLNLNSTPERQLHLTMQWSLAVLLLRCLYLEAVITAALKLMRPDAVCIPPAKYSINADPGFTEGQLQWMIYAVSSRNGIKCRLTLYSAVYHHISGLYAALKQFSHYGLLVAYDLAGICLWLWGRVWKQGRSARQFLEHRADSQPNGEDDKAGRAILLTNVDSDLGRQFDLKRLTPKLSRRCLVWLSRTGHIARYSEPSWQQRVLPLYLAGRWADGDAEMERTSIKVKRLTSLVFPTLVTPLVLKQRAIWYCSALPSRAASNASTHLRSLLAGREMARARLLNWRRIVYAAKHFASACDLFRAINPELLVVGEARDVDRALTLAARRCGVRSLATSHGLEVRSESFYDLYPLADVHCLFSYSSALISERNLPGVATKRIICHDYPLRVSEGKHRVVEGPNEVQGRRIFIVTGGIINHRLFVRQSAYAASLRKLVEYLSARTPEVEITFKSHPLFDQYELYEELRRSFPKTVKRHWREPLTGEKSIPADVVVFFNCLSTLFFTVVEQGIPIVAHYGAFTPLGRRVIRASDLAGSEDSLQLDAMIDEVLTEPFGALSRRVRARTESVCKEFIAVPIGGLEDAVKAATQRNPEEASLSHEETKYSIPIEQE